jgi:hypothetical protein
MYLLWRLTVSAADLTKNGRATPEARWWKSFEWSSAQCRVVNVT